MLLGCGLFLGWDEREDAAENFVVPGFEVVAHTPDALFGLLAELIRGLVRQIGREWNVVPQGRDGGVELTEFFEVPGFEVGFHLPEALVGFGEEGFAGRGGRGRGNDE